MGNCSGDMVVVLLMLHSQTVIFLFSCCRAAWQSAAADPSLPIGAALCYAVWRLFEKRKARNPDGPYWGNSPIWGALGTTLLALFAGFLVRLGMPRIRDNAL